MLTQYRNSHQKQHRTEIQSSICVVNKQGTLFDAVEFKQRYSGNPFALGDTYLTPIPNMCSSFPCNTLTKKTRKCNIEGLIPVAGLNGTVGSLSSFIKYMIGSTGKT